jgi:hypothetical protein
VRTKSRLPAKALRSFSTGLALEESRVDIDADVAAGFYAAAPLHQRRGSHTATLLRDGRVLVVGGLVDASRLATSAELYSLGAWTEIGVLPALETQGQPTSVSSGRYGHTATRLRDGRVLIAGGFGFDRLDAQGRPVYEALASAFLFDPANDTFQRVPGTMISARRGHSAVLLPIGPHQGKVLLHGGSATTPFTELYDPATQTFSRYTYTAGLAGSTATVFQNRVYFVGGREGAPCGVLDLRTETMRDVRLAHASTGVRFLNAWHQTVRVRNRLINVGGMDAAVDHYLLTNDVAYTVGDFNELRRAPVVGHRAVAFGRHGGALLVVGGMSLQPTGLQSADALHAARTAGELSHAELIMGGDRGTQSWRHAVRERYPLLTPRSGHTVTILRDGSALVVGGWRGGARPDNLDGTSIAACEVFVRP